jgi:transposase-like protein
LSLIGITKIFPDDQTAEAWIAANRWPEGPICPHCGSDRVQSGAAHATMPYRWRECRKRFSIRAGAVMQKSKLGYQVWAIATYLLTTGIKGTSSMKLHRDLGITQKSAWHLAHRIRATWADWNQARFTGPVEADETYIGGLRKNMHRQRRESLTGRSAAGKTPVAGVRDRASGRVSAAVVPDTTGRTLRGFVQERTEPGTMVYTDETPAYLALPYHQSVRHSVGEYVDGTVHANGLEPFWNLLKRGYQGDYRKMSEQHLNRYVAEFSGRFNDRDRDTLTQMDAIARGMLDRHLPYTDPTAQGGYPHA